MKQRMKKIMSVLVTLCLVTGLFMHLGATEEVHADDKALVKIEVTTPPAKTEYQSLEYFDKTGMVVTATYDDNSTENLGSSSYTCDVDILHTTIDKVTISFTYRGVTKTTTQNISVNAREGLSYLNIYDLPTKTEYYEGDYFDPSGMLVVAHYNSGFYRSVYDFVTIEPARPLTVSDQYVTISYTDGGITKTINQAINVAHVDVTLNSISISTPPAKTVYEVGDQFDKTGMVVMANWSDGTSTAITNYDISPEGQLSKNDTAVTLSYTVGGVTKTTTQAIEFKTLDRIEITTPPDKTQYKTFENFDSTGMVVKAIYNDNSSKVIVAGNSGYKIEPKRVTANNSTVTISYSDYGVTKTTTQAITVNDRGGLDHLYIGAEPSKTEYLVGEQFDPTGMGVVAVYNDGLTVNVNEYISIEPAGALSVADQYVIISFTDGSVTETITQAINVTSVNANLVEIYIDVPPTKTIYDVNEVFDATGMVVKANWSDGTSTAITNFEYSPVGKLSKNDTTVTISYTVGGVTKTTTQAIEFKTLDRIEITTPPDKIQYKTFENFDSTGMIVKAIYNDNSSKVIVAGNSGYKIEPKRVTANNSTVTISYSDYGVTKTTTQAITVNDRGGLDHLYIGDEPTKTEYLVGEQFDPTGMGVVAVYNDGLTVNVNECISIEPAGALSVADQYVIISFTDGSVTETITQAINVTPINANLVDIYVDVPPTKTVYDVNELFDATGMVVKANWSDGTSTAITNFEYSPVGKLSKNDTTVTISYTVGGVTKATTQAIEFKTLDRIEITTPPDKTQYKTFENFDSTGMVVKAIYNDNSSIVIDRSVAGSLGYTIEPTTVTANNSTVTISYSDYGVTKTTTQAITVNDRGGLDHLYIGAEPTKKEYLAGEHFDPTDMAVIAVYKDGFSRNINDYIKIEPVGALIVADKNITISFTDGNVNQTITQAINVIPSNADIVSIYVDTPSNKKIYEVGELFDKTGMVVKAKWSDGSITEVTNYQYSPNGQLSDTDKKITVNYSYNNETFTATQDIVFKTLDNILITTPPAKIIYNTYEDFDNTGMVITAIYNDNSSIEIPYTGNWGYDISPSVGLTVDDKEVIISYSEYGVTKTVIQPITVNPRELEDLYISKVPYKTQYTEGETFEPDGMVVVAKYKDGFEIKINDYATFEPLGVLKINDNNITVTYTEGNITKIATQTITVTGNNSENNSGNGETGNNGSGNTENNNSGNSGTENNGSENNNSGSNSGSNSSSTNTGNNNNNSNTGNSGSGNNSGTANTNNNTGTYTPASTITTTPEVPGTTTKEVENADGSKTTTTRTLEESGKVTETTVKESKNGDKSTTEVVTDGSGKIVSTIIETKTTNKSGTTTVSTTVKKADGSLSYSTVETYKSGKVVSKITETNADKSRRTVEETKQADGSTTKTVTKVSAGGSAKMTVTAETPAADDKEAKKTEFVYSMTESGKAKLVKATTDEAEITIPATVTINGIKCKVVTVGKSAFKGNTSITKIVMGKYVETIGTKAFAGLKNLNEISISSSKLSKVSKSAFAKISKDAKFYIKAKKSACKAIAALITGSGVKKVKYERVK